MQLKQFFTTKIQTLAIITLIMTYLSYHLIEGKRGASALFYVQKSIKEKKQLSQELHQRRVELEQKVRMLQLKSIEADFVQELAKDKLGMIENGEMMYIFNPGQ